MDGHAVDLGHFQAGQPGGARAGTSDGIAFTIEPIKSGQLAFWNNGKSWTDDPVYRVTLDVPADKISGDKLTLEFDGRTDSHVADESFKIDNLQIVAKTPIVPEPEGTRCVIDFDEGPGGHLRDGQALGHTFKIDVATFSMPNGDRSFGIQDTSDASALLPGSEDHLNTAQGNALVVQTGGGDKSVFPGRTDMHVTFDVPVYVQSITTMDNEEGGTIRALRADGSVIKSVAVPVVPTAGATRPLRCRSCASTPTGWPSRSSILPARPSSTTSPTTSRRLSPVPWKDATSAT